MKRVRFIASVALLLSVICLSGCVWLDGAFTTSSEHEQLFVNAVDALFDALDSGDKDAVKDLFAPAVVDRDGIDGQIDALFEFYEGPHTEIEGADLVHLYRHSGNDGDDFAKMSSSFTVTTENERLQVYMEMWSLNEADEAQVGIRLLDFATEEAAGGEDFVHYTTDWGYETGIYIQTSPERRSDVCRINDALYRYYATPDRSFTVEDIHQAIGQGASLTDLTRVLGEPNARWEEFGIYCYALSDGTFAFCGTQWEGADIDNGVDGDQIGYVCLSNEDELLDTLWLRDNVIRVSDEFCLYKPGKALPDADTFVEQVKADRSTRVLYKKFGEPHAYGFYQYYCLEDGTFLGFWAETDDEKVDKVILADERDQLAVLWSEP